MAISDENQFKVKLIHHIRSNATNIRERVVFDVTPDITENRNVNYRSLDPVAMPGNFQIYQNTSSRTFNVSNIKLISRTVAEATINYARLQLLKGWTMPYFGTGTQADTSRAAYVTPAGALTKDVGGNVIDLNTDGATSVRHTSSTAFGAPPPVILLSAYAKNNRQGHIKNVPVVIQSLGTPYPSDVDYIHTNEGIPFPIIMSIDLQLLETQSPRSFSNFDLRAYKEGRLENF